MMTTRFSPRTLIGYRRCSHMFAALVLLLFAAGVSLCSAEATQAPRPHIVFILADDLGYADVGFTGSKAIHTPHLDQLAASGTVLESFYVQPVCSPTRATLMTGRYPTHTGVYTVVRPHAKWGLPLEERTLADALREAGYHTAICGKWHLGEFQKAYQPTHRGFDKQYGHFFGALDYFTKLRNGHRDWYRNDQPCADEGYSTHLLAREACRMVRERPQDKPLFLYIPFQAVHGPYQVPDKYLTPYGRLSGNRQKYAGMVSAMDEAIGQILGALAETAMRDNTLIIFSSDNGGPNPGRITDNGPLRAGKGTIWEGGVRVCAFVNWPGHVPAGARIAQPIHMVDWYPTLVTLAGGSLQQPLPLDGADVWQTITANAKSPHDAILLCASPNRAAVRSGDWKLLMGVNTSARRTNVNSNNPQARRTAADGEPPVELYNLANDLGEKNNVASQYPEKVAELKTMLRQLLQGAVPPGETTAAKKP